VPAARPQSAHEGPRPRPPIQLPVGLRKGTAVSHETQTESRRPAFRAPPPSPHHSESESSSYFSAGAAHTSPPTALSTDDALRHLLMQLARSVPAAASALSHFPQQHQEQQSASRVSRSPPHAREVTALRDENEHLISRVTELEAEVRRVCVDTRERVLTASVAGATARSHDTAQRSLHDVSSSCRASAT
jgi:hypothetical protein